jgi:indole-3-glycerol phosphate synthase
MKILSNIVDHKIKEIASLKEMVTVKRLESSIFFNSSVVSMRTYLGRPETSGIIAEIKRSSPSAGLMKPNLDVESLSVAYMQAGATALSVLTDVTFFGGKNEDLTSARKFNYCPILRKDFIIDEYQVIETKSIGADCLLLIAACLSPAKCKALAKLGHQLGLEVLLEVHKEEELNCHVNEHIDLIGVNNRDLRDFNTDIERSIELANKIPEDFMKISESGISNVKQIRKLKEAGYQGFLIGGYFMKQADPDRACAALVNQLKSLEV